MCNYHFINHPHHHHHHHQYHHHYHHHHHHQCDHPHHYQRIANSLRSKGGTWAKPFRKHFNKLGSAILSQNRRHTPWSTSNNITEKIEFSQSFTNHHHWRHCCHLQIVLQKIVKELKKKDFTVISNISKKPLITIIVTVTIIAIFNITVIVIVSLVW